MIAETNSVKLANGAMHACGLDKVRQCTIQSTVTGFVVWQVWINQGDIILLGLREYQV